MLKKRKRILIADNQLLVREGIKHLLESDNSILLEGEAEGINQLEALFQKKEPDVLIMDYHQPGFYSLEDLEGIRLRYPKVKILVITSNEEKDSILRVLDIGIKNYILKQCDTEEFYQAWESTLKDEKFFCGRVIDAILEKHFPKKEDCKAIKLSKREVEIVQHIAKGLTNQGIANKLFLSTHTIGTHRKNILRKLGLNKASELVVYAMKNGIVDTEPQ